MSILVQKLLENNNDNDKELEGLSSIVHDIWTGWMQRVFDAKGHFNPDGTFTIDQTTISRIKQQMITKYDDLSEPEKEADRVQSRIILDYFDSIHKE